MIGREELEDIIRNTALPVPVVELADEPTPVIAQIIGLSIDRSGLVAHFDAPLSQFTSVSTEIYLDTLKLRRVILMGLLPVPQMPSESADTPILR